MQDIQKTAKINKQWLAGIAELSAIQGLNADVTKRYLFKCGLNVVLNMQKGSKEAGSKLNGRSIFLLIFFVVKSERKTLAENG